MTEHLKKARRGAASWLTRAVSLCEGITSRITSQLEVPEQEYLHCVNNFNKRLAAWDEAENNLEAAVTEEELEAEINSAADYREKSEQAIIQLVSAWSNAHPTVVAGDMIQPNGGSADFSGSFSDGAKANIRLPKIDLPKFCGDSIKFMTFWQQFEACVDNLEELPVISKFNYLASLLKGEAKSAVEGLSVTAENYEEAKRILKRRFGRKEVIIFSHMQSLLGLAVPDTMQVSNLSQFRDKLIAHVRALDSLDIKSDNFGVILTPIIVSKLPEEIRLEWSRDSDGKEADLDNLMYFLEKEVSRRERSQSFGVLGTSKPVETKKAHKSPGSAAALTTSYSGKKLLCDFCNKSHPTFKCFGYLKLNMPDRQKLVAEKKMCFKCLGKGHFAKKCEKVCSSCSGVHHETLCYGQHKENIGSDGVTTAGGAATLSVHKSHVSYLPTATVQVKGADGKWVIATLLFDSGSDRTYVSSALIKKVRPKWIKDTESSFSAFGGRTYKSTSKVFEMNVRGGQSDSEVLIAATEVPVICSPLVRPRIDTSLLEKFEHLKLANDFHEQSKTLSIDILIGQDVFWSLMLSGVFKPDDDSCPGVVAQESIFGWVLSGAGDTAYYGVALLNISDIPENVVRSFWDLESIGVKDDEGVNPVLEQFQSSIRYNDEAGRYRVKLSWKDNPPHLENNYTAAKAMFLSQERKLEKNPDLKHGYEAALSEMEKNGHVQQVPKDEIITSKPIFYLPHHPHVRESSTSTKIRPVFNASSRGKNGISLNDCLEPGPNLNPTVADLLMRFRRWKVALSADIQKAFLQIELDEDDQDVHRFLWRGLSELRTMKFTRVTFGINCSPFLLSATIRHHLSRCPPSVVTAELADNLYVDDFLSGADDEYSAHELFVEAKRVMEEAGMTLTKWSSNHPSVLGEPAGEIKSLLEFTKVLGVSWNQAQDCLIYTGVDLPKAVDYTKRIVLSLIARVYDPLGLVLPFTVTARFLFQEIWKLGLQWDELLPPAMKSVFEKWLDGIKSLKLIEIPRQYFDIAWSECLSNLELHVFGDSSIKGFGACVYLRCKTESGFNSSLVRACARVAPLERKTLPRLELLGCLVAAQLLCDVQENLHLPKTVKYYCWTDSMVALGWIKGSPSKWKPWVSNRVASIQEITSPESWQHVPGLENPADLVTRGVSAEVLASSELWWKGPSFLHANILPEREEIIIAPEDNTDVEVERRCKNIDEIVMACTSTTPVFPMEKWSTLNRAYRVIAWILRFVNKIRKKNSVTATGKDLSADELSVSKRVFLRILQRDHFSEEIQSLESGVAIRHDSKLVILRPFLDGDGLLRVRGRLQLSELSYESKHPVILPKCHGTLLLVRFHHVFKNHAGTDSMVTTMRADYEIFGLRQIAKKIKRSCVSCQRYDAQAFNEPAAPLPEVRVTKAPVFTVTGLDFAGPVYCLDVPKKKFYLCLFVCGVVRAVHLELVESLNRDDFVLAFRRFAALKRMPSVVYSDNGKNIVAGQKSLAVYLGPLAPKWKFICPRSPWWGGWWERLVRSVKNGIKKSVGKRCLTRSELETCLTEVAASINSRPLTFVGSDIESKPPLTPNHFLAGQGSQSLQSKVIEDPKNVTKKTLSLREQEMMLRLEEFWKIWSSEYLRSLPAAYQKFKKRGNIENGSVVLIKEDGLPRMQWMLGVVEKLHVGKDGIPRAADLRTVQGLRTRAIQRLYSLEVESAESLDIMQEDHSEQSAKSTDGIEPAGEEQQVDRADNDAYIAQPGGPVADPANRIPEADEKPGRTRKKPDRLGNNIYDNK